MKQIRTRGIFKNTDSIEDEVMGKEKMGRKGEKNETIERASREKRNKGENRI